MTTEDPHQYWEQGWDGHERAQLLRLSRLTLAEKIQWLEQAHDLVLALQRARPTRPADPMERPTS